MTNRRRPRKREVAKAVQQARGWGVFDWVIVIAFALILLIGGISALVQPEASGRAIENIPVPGSSIVVQVFNGSGDVNAAQSVAMVLSKLGVDVRDMVKDAGNVYPQTILLDRRGSSHTIDSLLIITGLGRDRIALQKDDNIFDATLVLGRDYQIALAKLMSTKE